HPLLAETPNLSLHDALPISIEEVLSDAPLSGSPGTFTAEQVTHILAIACEPPSQSGRPVETWTGRELADEAAQRGIVKSISVSRSEEHTSELQSRVDLVCRL